MRTGKSIDDRKLIGRLVPQDDWGPYVGFWATTYEMQPEFFETDFLPTVLDLGAWDDRHWTSHVAMERELAGMESAAVMVDACAYPGRPRSLRVEILPARDPLGGKLHAKVTMFLHERAVRLIVGSSNLTEPGYRQNIEIAASMAVTAKCPVHAGLVHEALAGAPHHLGRWWSDAADSLTRRALELVGKLPTSQSEPSEWFAWSGDAEPLWSQFLRRWPNDEPVRKVTIVSPFWSEEDGSGPLVRFLSELRAREILEEGAEVLLVTAATPEGERTWRPTLPGSYGSRDFAALGVRCYAQPVDPSVPEEEVLRDDLLVVRRLHAKAVLLEGSATALAYIGSANFTHRGWGFLANPGAANIEAGVVLRRSGRGRAELLQLVPRTAGERVPLLGASSAKLATPEPHREEPPWPTFVRAVRLAPLAENRQELALVVTVEPARVHGAWRVSYIPSGGELPEEPLVAGEGATAPEALHRTLSGDELRRLLREQEVLVSWWEYLAGRAFPINVAPGARDSLPISPDSRGPDEQMLLAYYQGRISYEELFPPEGDLPDSGVGLEGAEPSCVDTSRIQSYQIREFVESLDGIREDLKLACASDRSMRLALLGPVSPVALGRIVMESVAAARRTPMAAGFQLVEILACLDEAAELPGRDQWEGHREAAVEEIVGMLHSLRERHPAELGHGTAFGAYEACVRGRLGTGGEQR